MTTSSIQKILVAVDGSERSIQTVRYLADLPALKDASVHLVHIFQGLPESVYDLRKEPTGVKLMSDMLAWQRAYKEKIETYFEKCRKILLAANFHPQNIQTLLYQREFGIAADMISMARNGYDALILRRRGMSRLPGMIMGSVATKLLHRVDFLPLILAGPRTDGNRLAIGLDASDNAMRAVEFAGRMAAGSDCKIALISVLRGIKTWEENVMTHPTEASDTQEAKGDLLKRFDQARIRLAAAGIDSTNIKTMILQDVPSRSGALVDWAKANGYNTIVVGRKGISANEVWALGRVTDKLIHVGRRYHVWIVN